MTPAQAARRDIREKRHTGTTRGLAMGYVQCNLAVSAARGRVRLPPLLPAQPPRLPVLEVCDPGDPEPKRLAPGADLRTDLPRYAVYRAGERLDDVTDLRALWRDDLVAFLIGSGITFDDALERAGVPTDKDRWVLRSTIPTVPAGRFRGDMIVTMRWLTPQQAIRATQVSTGSRSTTARRSTSAIRTRSVPISRGRSSGRRQSASRRPRRRCFSTCGVTPQQAALDARVDLLLAHAPARGFVADVRSGGAYVVLNVGRAIKLSPPLARPGVDQSNSRPL